MSFAHLSSRILDDEEVHVSRAIGMDVHRDFCEVAIVAEGEVRSVGQIETTPAALELPGQRHTVHRVAEQVVGVQRFLQRHATSEVLGDRQIESAAAIGHDRARAARTDHSRVVADRHLTRIGSPEDRTGCGLAARRRRSAAVCAAGALECDAADRCPDARALL
jgi:hypothetical protein